MKTVASWSLCSLYAAGIGFAALFFADGCVMQPDYPEGLPESSIYTYDVAPELVPAFEAAADRIQWASGVVLVNVEGGTEISLLDESPQGSCADTYVMGYAEAHVVTKVYIDLYPAPAGCYQNLGDTLLHELIHSLRRFEDQGKEEVFHSTAGVFTAKAWRPVLETESLNAICEVVTCTQYQPEAL